MTMSPVTACLALLSVLSVSLATQMMPRFNFQPTNKVLLTWSDTWEVGTSNIVAILPMEKVITIRIAIGGDYGGRLKRILWYECPNNPSPQSIDLTTLTPSSSEVRCSNDMPFTVRSAGGANENFELKLGASRIQYTDAFNKKVKLSVQVDCPTGTLMSNPLFVWNLEPVSSFSTTVSSLINRRFLTDAAIKFMTKLNYSPEAPFPAITFLEPAITDVIKTAPQFFKSKLNLGSILYFDAGSCINYQLGKAMLFISYFSKFDERHQNLMKLMHLDILSGTLTFSACGLKEEVKQFFDDKRPATTIGICTMVSFSGEMEPYLKIEGVDQRFPVSNLSYKGCATAPRNCEVALNENAKVTVVSGMDNTAIVCPIVCNDKSEVYRFYRDGKPLIGSPTEEWSLVDGIRVAKTGNIVEFPPSVSGAHSGIYRCDAGSKQFSFDVTVVSVPHFTVPASSSTAQYGLLPERVFAMEGESLTYNCTVNFAGLSSVRVSPVFHIATTAVDKLSWVSLGEEEFRQKVDATKESLSLVATATQSSQTLTVTVARVPPVNPSTLTNFSHRFECSASVGSVESQLVGMAEYKIQSGSDVVFIPRLTREKFVPNPSNNCSVQKCSVSTGASFEFALTPDTVAYLNATGVEVVAFFRLDNLLLEDVKILFVNQASKVEFNKSSCTLTYRVEPLASQSVLDELLRRKSLTAVYNLRYRPGTPLANLWHNKTAHKSVTRLDCRDDPLCFYSTDFDLTTAWLSDALSVDLDFELAPLPPPVTAGSSGILIGIGVAAIAALIVGLISAYLLTRSPERAYLVEAKEIQLGHNPRAEAREEVFKEYLHAGADQEDVPSPVLGVKRSLASTASINSKDDLELS